MIFTINGNKFKLRNCKDNDYWFVYKLLKNNMLALFTKHWGGWDPKVFREAFKKENIKIVEHKNKRIAYYNLEFKDKFSYIHNVQVSTLMRGKGLGTFLMGLMEKETKKHRLKKIRLKVFKDNKAIELYLKLEYKKIKDDKSAIILEKVLWRKPTN